MHLKYLKQTRIYETYNLPPPPYLYSRNEALGIQEGSLIHPISDGLKISIVGFGTNKWDSVGKEHNDCLQYVLSKISKLGGSCDLVSLVSEFAANRGKLQEFLDLNLNLSEVAVGLNNAFPQGILSIDYFTGISGIPLAEEEYLISYLNTMLNIRTTVGIIGFSKIQESVIISNSSLSPVSRDRLLRMMALSRYSASFWNSVHFEPVNQESSNFINLYGPLLDSLVEYICIKEGLADCSGVCSTVASIYSLMCFIGIY